MPWQIDGKTEDNRLVQRDIATERLKTVHYVEGGNTDGMPVVFLHDNLASSRWWEAAQEQLSYRYHSFAPDLRGYGTTEFQPASSIEDFALDLADLVKTLGLAKFFLVGWGLGGGIAMQYAVQQPDMLAGLCLVNSISPHGHQTRQSNSELDQITRAIDNNQSDEVAKYIRRNYFRSGNFPVGDLTEGGEIGTDANAQKVAFDYILAGSMQSRMTEHAAQEGIFNALRDFDVRGAVGKLPMPVFGILGDTDRGDQAGRNGRNSSSLCHRPIRRSDLAFLRPCPDGRASRSLYRKPEWVYWSAKFSACSSSQHFIGGGAYGRKRSG